MWRAGVWQQGPGGPIGRAGCGPDGPFIPGGRSCGAREASPQGEGVAIASMPAWRAWRNQVGVPAGAGLVADPVQVRSDRVDRQEQAELTIAAIG